MCRSAISYSRFSTSDQENNSVCMDHPKIFYHKIYHRRFGLHLVLLLTRTFNALNWITSSSLFPSHYIRDFFCLLGDDFSVSFFTKQIFSQERFDPLYIGFYMFKLLPAVLFKMVVVKLHFRAFSLNFQNNAHIRLYFATLYITSKVTNSRE